MTPEAWFRVDRDIPEISATNGDLVMVDGEEVWVCTKHGPDLLWTHRASLVSLTERQPSAVSDPIEALSDLAALFELIKSCGGRMPGEVDQ